MTSQLSQLKDFVNQNGKLYVLNLCENFTFIDKILMNHNFLVQWQILDDCFLGSVYVKRALVQLK